VGGGKVALRKVLHLLDAEAEVTVVGPGACPDIGALAERKRIQLKSRAFVERDVKPCFLVFAATDDGCVNRQVLEACRRHGVLCCAVDDGWPQSSFVTPAIFRKDDLTVAVSTGGRSCRQARAIKNALARHVETVETADLLVLGVSHASLSLEDRESYHLAGARLAETGRLVRQVWGVHEFMLLNTCNRSELISVVSRQPETTEVLRRLMGFDHLPTAAFYEPAGYDAYRHVALLMAGLLSQMPGEGHIAGQVKEALKTATEAGWADAMIEEWIHSALHVSRHIRDRTAPLLKPVEVEDLCLDYLEAEGAGLKGRRVVVLGTGAVGKGLVDRLRRKGASCTWCYHTNRPAGAGRKADSAEVAVCSFREMEAPLARADLVLCAASASEPLLHAEHAALFDRERKAIVVDLGVPRNVAPELKGSAGESFRVVDLDDLKRWRRNDPAAMAPAIEIGRNTVAEHRTLYDKLIRSFQGWRPRQPAGVVADA